MTEKELVAAISARFECGYIELRVDHHTERDVWEARIFDPETSAMGGSSHEAMTNLAKALGVEIPPP